MDNFKQPRVGMGVIVIKEGKILLGKRKSSHGEGSWGFPGGHLEFKESLENCARREVLEETGIEINNIKKAAFTNDIFLNEDKHYITIFMISTYQSGELKVMEPDKCEGWEWFSWDNLPHPLFTPIQNLLKENFNPFKNC